MIQPNCIYIYLFKNTFFGQQEVVAGVVSISVAVAVLKIPRGRTKAKKRRCAFISEFSFGLNIKSK